MNAISITKRVGSFEAKTHLSELLEQAGRGECIEITKRGKPMAVLISPERLNGPTQHDLSELMDRVRARGLRLKTTPEDLRSWRREGQKA